MGKNNNLVVQKYVRSDRAAIANVEIDQRTTFESAIKLFKREVNNSNIINEMKRRRYHEESLMMRRRKKKERTMKNKFLNRVITFEDKNPLTENTIFSHEYCVSNKFIDFQDNEIIK